VDTIRWRRRPSRVWIERQIEAGRVASYAEMARVLGVSRARVTQLVGLVLRPVGVREGWLVVREDRVRKAGCMRTAAT